MKADADISTRGAAARPWWRDPRWWRLAAATYAIAAASGYLFARLGVPLPWMLGPFFICGAISASGRELAVVPYGRETGQLMVGLTVGLRFTPATLLATLSLLPAMLLATLYVMVYTMAASFFFRPMAGVDRATAFFATAAGGVADMALVARQRGGDAAAVAIVHALRVSLTVAIVPILVVTLGTPGTAPDTAAAGGQGLIWLAFAIAGAVLCVQILKQKTALPNPWLVGPMFFGILLGATGMLVLAVPPIVIIVAQILLGTWLGCRFRREVLITLPRVAIAGVAASLFMMIAAFIGALALAGTTSLSVSTAFLALAPAAVTEMVITAKAMHLDAEIVTAFHVMRIFIVCSTILLTCRLHEYLQGAADASRI